MISVFSVLIVSTISMHTLSKGNTMVIATMSVAIPMANIIAVKKGASKAYK